jgi:hypothetical protein
MTPPSNIDALYELLLSLSRNAFEDNLFEVAGHGLAAALYLASVTLDEDRLLQIGYLASEHQSLLDRRAPTHRMASRHTGLFQLLSRLALYRYVLLQTQHDQEW